jgi:hypothetical protein
VEVLIGRLDTLMTRGRAVTVPSTT